MGGETSEVVDGTTRVLIEAAHFDAPSVMFTAKRHELAHRGILSIRAGCRSQLVGPGSRAGCGHDG